LTAISDKTIIFIYLLRCGEDKVWQRGTKKSRKEESVSDSVSVRKENQTRFRKEKFADINLIKMLGTSRRIGLFSPTRAIIKNSLRIF
jgi:hypothetical protein